jgi:sugar-specific transcriptional regulator TrmB
MTPQKADQQSGPVRGRAKTGIKASKTQQVLQETLQAQSDLSTSEAAVYTALLAMGQLTPYEASVYSNLPLAEAEPALEALVIKKLAKVMPGIVRRYLALGPYKAFAALVDEFHTQASTALQELQAQQQLVAKEIPGQLDGAALQLGKMLARNYQTNSKILGTAVTKLRAALVNLTHAQRKSLNDLSDSTANDFSSETAALQKSLSQNVDDGIRQLQDAYGVALEEPLKLITAHGQTSQQWLDSSKDCVLGHLDTCRTQLRAHLGNFTANLKETTETTAKSTRANAAAKLEIAHRQLQETETTLTSRIQAFGKKQRQSIDVWQKQQAQMIKQAVQTLGQNQRESLSQATRAIAQIRSDIDKTLNKENQRIAQDFERSTGEIVSITDDWGETATQIGDSLFLNLRTAISERVQGFLQLQKEIETTVSQWPPTGLTFAQLGKLKESLSKITQGAAKESGKLAKLTEKTISAELRDAPLELLTEQETLVQSLADSLAARALALTKNIDVTVSKLAKSIDTQSAAARKTFDTAAKALQDKLRQQERLGEDLRQKGKLTISEQATAVAGVLGAVGSKLRQFAETSIPARNEAVQDLTASCTAKIGDHAKVLGKHLNILEATLARYVNETNQSLQQKLDRLEGLVNQYAQDVETTATRLLDEQAAELQRTQASYHTILEKQLAKRDKQVTQTLQAPLDQVKKSQNDLLQPLQQAFDEAVTRYAQTALTDYHTTLTNEHPALHDHAATAFQTTLRKLIEQDSPAILAKQTIGGTQAVQDSIEQALFAVQDAIHESDSANEQLVERAFGDLGAAIQQYASTNLSNLTALNTAINNALEQEFNTLAAFVVSFEDRAKESLTRTMQTIKQEDQTLAESIGATQSQTSESWQTQLSQTRTLFDTLGQELVSQVATLARNTEAVTEDYDTAMNSGLAAFRGAGDALVQDLLKQTQLFAEQNQDLSQKGQTLIRQQATTAAEAVEATSNELGQFVKDRIPNAKETVQQVSGAYLASINDYQMTFEKQLKRLESEIAVACDDYVSTLQQELAQLQSEAAKMAEQVSETGQSLETTLNEQIEKSLTTYLTEIEQKGIQLHEEVSTAFSATLTSFGKIQGNLLSVLSQDIQNGKTTLEEAIARAGSTLEETIRGTSSQGETLVETFRKALAGAVEESATQMEATFATAHAAINTALDDAAETISQILARFQVEIDTNLAASAQSLSQETDNLKDTITADVASAASSLAEASAQTKDKLDQMGRDGFLRAGELIRLIQDTALASVEERARGITTRIRQFATLADQSLLTQARQTVKQVSSDLKTVHQTMKREGQDLAKVSRNVLKQTGTATLTLSETFAQKAGPALTQVETEAASLEQTLAKLWDVATHLELSETERTWRIVTKEGVQNHLLDMLRRARTTVTLVYPSLEEVPVDQLQAIPPNCRLHLITTLDRVKHGEALRRLLAKRNVRIWHTPKAEFYAGSRDGEEILIAPIPGELEELVAVASDHGSYVALFNQSLGPRWISGAEEIVERKPPEP